MKQLLFVLALVFALVAAPAAPAAAEQPNNEPAAPTSSPAPADAEVDVQIHPLEPTADQEQTATLVANLMTRYHYHAQPLDDAMSRKIMAAYLDMLDSQRMIFTQKDIAEFEQWRTGLDDAIWNGELKPAFVIFNRYRQSLAEQVEYALSLLDKGFDFSKQESFQLDRSEAAWPASQSALDDLWRRRVKNDWLRLKLADKDDAAIRKLLTERYSSYLDRISQVEGADVFQMFMNAYATSTDPHTSYMGARAAENFAIAMKLSLEGIGAVLEMRNDYTQVRRIVAGGPADKSDALHPGDRIIGVAQGDDGPMKNVVGWRLDDVVQKIRGEKGSIVRLKILPAETGLGGKSETIRLERAKVSIKAQAAKKDIIEVTEDGVTHKVGVIDLPSFYQDFAAHRAGKADFRSASRDVAKLIRELKQKHVDAIIMDLRNNGGGSLSEATHMTGLFIGTGPVVQVRDWRGKVHARRDDRPGLVWSGPLAVLVNRGSASASEIFTAAIQDYGRGLIIGSNTFGKGTVQNLVNLDRVAGGDDDSHGELKMTIAQFYRINGGSTQLRGVAPDIVFPSGIDKDDFGESSYKNALEWNSITPAHYEPDADAAALLPMLKREHQQRIADNPEWQLRVAQLELAENMRERTEVSLNLAARREQRKQYKAKREALTAKYRPESVEPAASASVASAASAATVAKAASVAAASSAATPASTGIVVLDDGLAPGERSLESELARKEAAENRKDVRLIETAHILADVVEAINAKPKLADVVLPETDSKVD